MTGQRVCRLGVLLLCLTPLAAHGAAPPAQRTAEQKAQLAERDALEKQVPALIQQRQFDKAIAMMERIAALEKAVLGETHAKVIDSLQRLAAWREQREQFVKAIRVREEVVRLQEKRLGQEHWLATDARLALRHSRLMAGLDAAERAQVRQAEAWDRQVLRLYQQGRFPAAVELALQVRAVRRKVLGEQHPHYAQSLNNLAVLYQAMGEHGKALTLLLESRDLCCKVLGEKHPDYASSLNNLGMLYQAMGEHGKALPLFLEARDLIRKMRGEKHRLYAVSLNSLASVYQAMGEHGKALTLALEVRDLCRKVLGEKHPDYASSLNNLALLYQDMGEHGKALPLSLEARDLRHKVLGEKHPHYAVSLGSLASVYQAMGEHGKALTLFREARDLNRQVLGEKHPEYAGSLNNLALLYKAMGEYAKALSLSLEARELYRQTLGEKHPRYATSLQRLALLYQAMGEHGKAVTLFREARDLRRKVLGEKHPAYATSLNNLANLYQAMGEHGKALTLALEARDLCRKVLGEKHPDYARSLSSLGMLYRAMGEHDKAAPLFLEARDRIRKVLGEKHPDYATSVNNLAMLYQAMGEHDKALPLLLEARDLYRKLLGEKHPDYASSLNNLAFLYQAMGEPGKALPLSLEARDLRHKVLGEKHPHYALSLSSLAGLYHDLGEHGKALAASRQALTVLESYLEEGFNHLGEAQRVQIIGNVLRNLGGLLSLQEQAGQPLAQAYDAVLAWKGCVAARMTLDRLLRDRPELKGPLSRLQSVRGRLARLGMQTPEPRRHAAWLKELQGLADEKATLESELSRLSAEARRLQQHKRLTPAQVSKEMPADTAFVDLIVYDYQIAPAGGKGRLRAELRLLAFVVRRGKEPVAVPLGALKPVAAAVARWRREVDKPPTQADRKAITQAGEELRRRVWLPLVKHLGAAKTVVLAPDGVLCQFPLAALPGEKAGSFLLEEIGIAQVSSAQHLLELLQPAQKPRGPARGLLAVGGVDYGSGKVYAALPGTAVEVDRCGTLFRRAYAEEPAVILSGKAASVAAVRQTLAEKRPRFLHLATHGFFEPPERVERLLRGVAAGKDGLALGRDQTVTLAGLPLLRCGLALAGANQSEADGADGRRGVLSGEDVEGLDLRGCELAVLSACQTALGDVKRSQGVLGLQRSFHAAGVRTMLSSLWSVSDAATLELMDEFYARLWGKEKVSRLEALRQAQLAVLRHPERVRHRREVLLAAARKRGVSEEELRGIKGKLATDLPEGGKIEEAGKRSPEAWWAAFVLSGDWR